MTRITLITLIALIALITLITLIALITKRMAAAVRSFGPLSQSHQSR